MVVVDYAAVLVATIAAYAVGAIWYSVLFKKPWMKLMGITPESMKKANISPALSMTIGFFTVLLMTYMLAHFFGLIGVLDIHGALLTSFWVWLGFQAPLMANSILYENRPFNLYVINASQQLVAMLVAGAVLILF